ncbi:MAG: hypothetical protein KatS3mg085_560 [Candidatus Dojkabacteria bacterium]|nr:MAG: hypothetical protein KatS3mg085_560 [Candidatus Dojkabacteria bacterium]
MSIWQYREISKKLDGEHLTLNEGDTPFDEISFNKLKLFVKREDQNPSNSWKDRMTAFLISKLKNKRITRGVLSTSGNAGISFLHYSKLYPELTLDIIVSNTINSEKLQKIKSLIQNTKHRLHQTNKAKLLRAKLVSSEQSYPISSSFDDDALIGYWSLGFELAAFINKINQKIPIVFPASSGAGVVGAVQGIAMKIKNHDLFPQIVVCQTESVHPLLPAEPISNNQSLADSITDKSMKRSYQVQKIINSTNGKAYVITNKELLNLKDKFNQYSYTSLLSIAGAIKFTAEHNLENSIVIASGM